MSRYKPIYYIRMVITDTKSYSTYTQLSKVELYRNIDFFHLEVPISWDSTTVTCNKQAVTDEEGASNLIDGSVDTKACFDSGVPSSENPVIITFSNQEGFDFTPNEYDNGEYGVYKNPVYWKWYTANDSPERDPATFSLQISYDGIKWETVDGRDKDHWTVTDNRKAKAYNGEILLFPRHKPIDLNDLSYIKQYIDDNDLALDINTQTITTEFTLYDYETYAEDSVSVHYVNIPNYTICGHSAVGIIIAIDIYYKIFIHSSSGCICVNRDNGSSWYELAFKSAIPTNISQLNNNRDFVNGIWIGDDFYEPFEDPDSPQENAVSISLPEYPDWSELLTTPSGVSTISTFETLNNPSTFVVDDPDYGIRIFAVDIPYQEIAPGIPADGIIINYIYNIEHTGGQIQPHQRQFFIAHSEVGQQYHSDYDLLMRYSYDIIGSTDCVFSSWKKITPDTRGTQTVSGNPITVTDAEAMNAESVVVELEPKQDLHGYDSPWVGGAGKNKLDPSYLVGFDESGLQVVNSNGVLSITGSPSSDFNHRLATSIPLKAGTYKISKGSSNTYPQLLISYDNQYIAYVGDTEQSITIPSDGDINIDMYTTAGSYSDTFYPMIRLSTESDPTFAPYSNICPITGYSEVEISDSKPNRYVDGTVTFKQALSWETDNTISATTITGISANGNVINGTPSTPYFWMHIPFKFEKGKTIYLSVSSTPPLAIFRISNNDGTYKTYVPLNDAYTPTEDFNGFIDLGFDSALFNNYKFGFGYTSTFDIDDYNKSAIPTYTIDLDGTKYGGKLDVTEGVLTVTHSFVQTTWGEMTNPQVSGDYTFKTIPNLNCKSTGDAVGNLCNLTDNEASNLNQNVHYWCQENLGAVVSLLSDTPNDTVVQIYYELATPLTIQLTPTQIQMLENTNNISTDGTNITLKYQPNNVIGECKAYTDEQIEKIPMPSGYKETIVWKYTGNEQAMPHGFPATTITIDNTTAPGFKLKKALRFYFRGYKMIVVPGHYPNYGLQSQDMLTAFMSSGDSYRVALQGSFINNTDIVYKRFASVTYTKTGDDESLEVAFDVCSNGNRTDNDYIIPLYITTVDYELDSLVSLS